MQSHMRPQLLLVIGWVFVSIHTTAALIDPPPASPTQTTQTLEKTITYTVRLSYLLHLPASYQTSGATDWPLLIFLHGSGEKGTNVTLVQVHGPPKIVAEQPEFPFILVSPQCPLGQSGWQDRDVLALIDEIVGRYRVDRKRIYLTGLSMGGYGVWSLTTSHPEMFAAVVPICGGGDPADVEWTAQQKPGAIASIGVWAFHGAEDKVVPLSESQDMVNAFRKAGCKDISLTVYEGTGHNAWAKAYEDPKLFEWLLRHRRD